MAKWQNEWKNNLNSVLEDHPLHTEEEKEVLKTISNRYPVSIPQYYLDLIDPEDPNDPIKLLSYPNLFEADLAGDADTSGESTNTKLPGLQHKYATTALVLTTNACFMYCRHCFRKRMVGHSSDEINQMKDQAISYIRDHSEINNVLLSGGDSFCMNNRQIEAYLQGLTEIDHLDFIRFGTRSLVVFPERVTSDPELLDLLDGYNKKKKILVITQFNHPKELTKEAQEAIDALLTRGITVHNQTVVLKGINDHPQTMADLLNGLTRMGVMPYYVFQCRPVKAVKTGFQLPLIETYELIHETRKRLSGVSKRFRLIMSHVRGKIEIMAVHEGQMIFRFHNAKNPQDQSSVFMLPIDRQGTWLDGDLKFIK